MTNKKTPNNLIGRRRLVLGVIAAIAVVAIVSVGAMLAGTSANNEGGQPTFAVQRGPLTISVSESGTVKAREQVILKSEVEGRPTIIYLIDEGTHVKKGDLLVELDASELNDKLVDQQIRVQNAEAAFIRSREDLAVTQSQAKSDIAQAELDAQFAEEDLVKYVDGEYPKLLKESESKITLAKEELERASEKLKWSDRLFAEKYISQTELESDRLALNRTKLDYDLALADLDLLKQYTYKRKLAELKSDVDQAKMALDRVRRKAAANVVQAEADLRAKESEFNRQKDKLAKIEDQIAKCRIIAPTEGMVIYATTGQGGWRGNTEPLDEGQQVRERQELIHLPTASSKMVEVKVHEASLEKVKLGQPARITTDALPGRAFTGRVTRISPLPDAQSVWLNPDLKVYGTDILLEGDTTDLRTGMTCRAEIIVDHYEQAVYVPVQAVIRVGSQPTVYVMDSDQPQPRPVQAGLDNGRMVRIVTGLEPGETVLLTPPLSAGSTSPMAIISPKSNENDEGDTANPNSAAALVKRANDEPLAAANTEVTEQDASANSTESGDGESGSPDLSKLADQLTPEQREKIRERMQNMSPEQREAMRKQWMQRRAQSQNEGEQ